MFYRHWGHILLGVALPWIPLGMALILVLLFLGYELLQYLYNTNWISRGYCYKDDSYLDVKEVTVYCGISTAVLLVLYYIGILQGMMNSGIFPQVI
jgi:hypothetical protein